MHRLTLIRCQLNSKKTSNTNSDSVTITDNRNGKFKFNTISN